MQTGLAAHLQHRLWRCLLCCSMVPHDLRRKLIGSGAVADATASCRLRVPAPLLQSAKRICQGKVALSLCSSVQSYRSP